MATVRVRFSSFELKPDTLVDYVRTCITAYFYDYSAIPLGDVRLKLETMYDVSVSPQELLRAFVTLVANGSLELHETDGGPHFHFSVKK